MWCVYLIEQFDAEVPWHCTWTWTIVNRVRSYTLQPGMTEQEIVDCSLKTGCRMDTRKDNTLRKWRKSATTAAGIPASTTYGFITGTVSFGAWYMTATATVLWPLSCLTRDHRTISCLT